MVRCSAKTLKGTRCKNTRINGFTVCSTHISASGKQASKGKWFSTGLDRKVYLKNKECQYSPNGQHQPVLYKSALYNSCKWCGFYISKL